MSNNNNDARSAAASFIHALNGFGDWWTALLLREAFSGTRTFAAFQTNLAIARQTLTNRLREMVENGIFYIKPYQVRPVRHEYRLTGKGLALYGYALMCWKWNRKWGDKRDATLPTRLVHVLCRRSFQPLCACAHCHREVAFDELRWAEAPSKSARKIARRSRAKRLTVSRSVAEGNNLYQHGAFVMTDRWSHAILGWVFLGHSSFDDFEKELAIAPSTLANRLRHLLEARLLLRESDPSDARRVHYRLTERGRDLFPISLMLRRWAELWTPNPHGAATLVYHSVCGHELVPLAQCSNCRKELKWFDVQYDWARRRKPSP